MYSNFCNDTLRQTIGFIITEDCNLKCKYCYEENKSRQKMTSTTMRKAVDSILLRDFSVPAVTYEVIGGEPFMEIGLIKELTEYTMRRQLELNHQWQNNFVFSFVTNGTMFTEEVKEFLMFDKVRKNVSLSLDGVKEIQDKNRSNSFDKIMKDIEWWKQNYPKNIIKSTLNRESLPYICDSIKFFVDDLKLPIVMMNVVFEDIWQENDDQLFYEQLIKAADFLLEKDRYKRHNISLFNEKILNGNVDDNAVKCGCGNTMLYVDSNGVFYPCIRFKFLNNQQPYSIGTINEPRFDYNKQIAFEYYHNFKDEECKNCKYESSCQHCLGYDYDQLGTIMQRTKATCKMHKARCKANEYFFDKINKR